MQNQLSVLDAMPDPDEFYGLFWNRRPFVVKGGISEAVMDDLIGADELAGLAMEETAQSRLVETATNPQDWSCRFGPFDEDDFDKLGDKDWSLLVQNVEQFHPETASLLTHFGVSPRWMLDDVMVSFSAPGGSVGPHMDSYHVFLVQGQGTRTWKISHDKIRNETYVDHPDIKILAEPFEGENIDVSLGDVIYLPPQFGHQGTTHEASLTFSVGFLGPKISELFGSYGQYLAEQEKLDPRYVGDGLGSDSAGFSLSSAVVDDLRHCLSAPLHSNDFQRWLVEYFTEPSHPDFGDYSARETIVSLSDFTDHIERGRHLVKPPYVKCAITTSDAGGFILGVGRQSFTLDENLLPTIHSLMKEQPYSPDQDLPVGNQPDCLEFLLDLYNHQVLEFSGPEDIT